LTEEIDIHVTTTRYPDPPGNFVLSPEVETMWVRFLGYHAGREPLASMGYFCLTVVGESAGGRRLASRQYSIAEDVLRKLGELTSTVGSEKTARKLPPPSRRRVHTGQEIAWIEAAVKALIRRMGEYASDRTRAWPRVTMTQLPQLP
jgi:hypothetical protein